MQRLILTDLGTVLDVERRQPIQEWVRQQAAAGQHEIRIDLAQVTSPNSDVLVALSLAARQASELGLPVVLVHANETVRLALKQLGLVELGITLGGEPSRPVTTSRHRASGSRPLVLVVDDDPINRKVAALLLVHIGCETCEAEHGLAAVEVCRRRLVDLVLMDVAMPVMNGHDATKMIRSSEGLQGRRIPIIGLSAHALPEDHAAADASGMDGYLTKPLDLVVFSQLLQRWLPGRTRVVERDDIG